MGGAIRHEQVRGTHITNDLRINTRADSRTGWIPRHLVSLFFVSGTITHHLVHVCKRIKNSCKNLDSGQVTASKSRKFKMAAMLMSTSRVLKSGSRRNKDYQRFDMQCTWSMLQH